MTSSFQSVSILVAKSDLFKEVNQSERPFKLSLFRSVLVVSMPQFWFLVMLCSTYYLKPFLNVTLQSHIKLSSVTHHFVGGFVLRSNARPVCNQIS